MALPKPIKDRRAIRCVLGFHPKPIRKIGSALICPLCGKGKKS